MARDVTDDTMSTTRLRLQHSLEYKTLPPERAVGLGCFGWCARSFETVERYHAVWQLMFAAKIFCFLNGELHTALHVNQTSPPTVIPFHLLTVVFLEPSRTAAALERAYSLNASIHSYMPRQQGSDRRLAPVSPRVCWHRGKSRMCSQ